MIVLENNVYMCFVWCPIRFKSLFCRRGCESEGAFQEDKWAEKEVLASQTWEGVQLLFAAIDIKLATRVLRMGKISKEQLLWCEEKMKKLYFSSGKLQRHPSPILSPSC
ncbi:hypothetical protein Bca4012_073507 [Brassica carinata]|uniref:Uncharacterized protein n=1 Tax=Brassica carinata TaxID=52824 RepID=A0A8X7QPX6_BRACI|nr:hypothetical protein Bca52824_065809 [Brassica carinata]